jgi:hypothetical protein
VKDMYETFYLELCWNDFFKLGCEGAETWVFTGCEGLISTKYVESLIQNRISDYYYQIQVPNTLHWHRNFMLLAPNARIHMRNNFFNIDSHHIVNKQIYQLIDHISDYRFKIDTIAMMGYGIGFITYLIGNCKDVSPCIKKFYYEHIIQSLLHFIHKIA